MNLRDQASILAKLLRTACFALLPAIAFAQNQASQQDQAIPASFLTTKTVQAVGYEVGGGSTKVDLKSTELIPQASGEAKIEIKAKTSRAGVEVNVKGLPPASSLGVELLTYVVWVVTPEGRTGN